MDSKKNILAQLWALFLIVGPGLFCVGYTIGTGSVTSMIVAGSKYGTEYLWVVALSCLFSGVLMEAYGRFALATGETAIHAFRKRFGAFFALLVMIMVIAGQWCCLSGLVGLSSNAFYEGVNLYFPDFIAKYGSNARICGLIIAIVLLVSLYLIFWFGSYSRIDSVLVVLLGLISAGISSILPSAMIAGYLQGDFRNGSMEVRTPVFRVLTAIACLMGLIVPILGANPVTAQVATQVAQVFVLPLIIGGITILVNRKSLMKEHRAGIFLNLGLIASFGFSLVISWQALIGVIDLLK